MDLKKSIKKIAAVALMIVTTSTISAQDKIANYAPVDRKAKVLDTLALQSMIMKESYDMPANELYDDWDNKYAHRATALPDSFNINLRHYHMPTPSKVITSNFGLRWGRMHKGLDIKVYLGDTIRAAFSGKVRVVRFERNGYGNYVVIRHDNGLETIYGHLSKHLVKENMNVRAGDPIGLGGSTGRSTGTHLHFETRLCGVALNPALFFDFRAQDVTADNYMFRRSSIDKESARATKLRGKNDDKGYKPSDVNGGNSVAQTSQQGTKVSDSSYRGTVRYHKVEAGETLYSIARKRGVSVDELCKLNHIGKNMHVRKGQLIKY
ncbi:MAG: peptidoglycan DD-metalloendopeptidase family protein [Prevotella sp.]|nr:peptidoglycan DD-metalloendopeptidase family protein [Prevotella sp.]